jgi:hypothetical protein
MICQKFNVLKPLLGVGQRKREGEAREEVRASHHAHTQKRIEIEE